MGKQFRSLKCVKQF